MKQAGSRQVALAATSNVGFAFIAVGVQIVTFGVLARLLTPQDYGVFAFANAILVYLAHLSQRGLSSSLVRKPVLTPKDVGAAYFMCVVIALAMCLVIITIFGLLLLVSRGALLLQAQLLLFMTLPLAIQILLTPASAQLQRRLAMVSVNLIQIGSVLIGNGVVAITCAKAGLGSWSLAFGSAAVSLASAVPTLWLGRSQVEFEWKWPHLWSALKEGLQFNGLRSLDIAWVQAPLVILGSSAPASFVGIYQRMQFLADLGMQMTVWRVSSVLYAALARRSDREDIDKAKYRTVLTIISTLVLPIVAFVLVAGHAIVAVLLGQNWLGGVSTIRLLIVAFGLSTINQAAGMALEHAGRLKQRSASAALAVILIVALLFLVPRGRPEFYALPALISMACSSVLLHVIIGERFRDLPGLFKAVAPGLLLALATGAGAVAGAVALNQAWATAPPLALLLAQFAAAMALNTLCVPAVCSFSSFRPLMEVFRSGFPGLFAATRFVHRLNVER